MMHPEVEVNIDHSEVTEMIAVMDHWTGRSAQLPKALRDEINRLSVAGPGALVETVGSEFNIELIASASLRALVANLRAREP